VPVPTLVIEPCVRRSPEECSAAGRELAYDFAAMMKLIHDQPGTVHRRGL
jgi:hypothetical protein